MCLLCQLIVGVTIRIDGTIHLLKGHECMDKSVIRIEKTAEILFMLNMVDLRWSVPVGLSKSGRGVQLT